MTGSHRVSGPGSVQRRRRMAWRRSSNDWASPGRRPRRSPCSDQSKSRSRASPSPDGCFDRAPALTAGCRLLRRVTLIRTDRPRSGSRPSTTAATPGRFGSLPVSPRPLVLDRSSDLVADGRSVAFVPMHVEGVGCACVPPPEMRQPSFGASPRSVWPPLRAATVSPRGSGSRASGRRERGATRLCSGR